MFTSTSVYYFLLNASFYIVHNSDTTKDVLLLLLQFSKCFISINFSFSVVFQLPQFFIHKTVLYISFIRTFTNARFTRKNRYVVNYLYSRASIEYIGAKITLSIISIFFFFFQGLVLSRLYIFF